MVLPFQPNKLSHFYFCDIFGSCWRIVTIFHHYNQKWSAHTYFVWSVSPGADYDQVRTASQVNWLLYQFISATNAVLVNKFHMWYSSELRPGLFRDHISSEIMFGISLHSSLTGSWARCLWSTYWNQWTETWDIAEIQVA